eukprot:CAMPEP_0177327656 /NCGR_PEP_ID=MMETSP0368-20130122/19011_1 /TAXON_ID=447022 ORGANISM="Scrippsiella hangoei-like, Strain SHHI-4" /NCGR_SAMPLE_ID=MMETSP0368 /ASSEMBLY_ACC=CAM_ASM_000363 /LENGTH=279 /DNA_ID=CAMNT_0018787741 /DNA_START=45 /DNA_END=886 /DNA_ORIENTATION=+
MNDSLRRYSAEQVSHVVPTWLVLRNTAAMSFHVRVDDDAAKPSRLILLDMPLRHATAPPWAGAAVGAVARLNDLNHALEAVTAAILGGLDQRPELDRIQPLRLGKSRGCRRSDAHVEGGLHVLAGVLQREVAVEALGLEEGGRQPSAAQEVVLLEAALSYNSNTKTSSEETFWSSPRWFQIGFNEFLTESVLNEHEGLSCTFTTQYGSDLPKPGIQSAFRSPLAPTTTTLTGLGVSASSLEEGVRSVSTFPVSAFVESPDGHLVLVGIGVLGLSNSTGM